MINEIQGISSSDTSTYSKNTAENIGRDEFLKIFLAQMRYQDPMSPMEGTEFTAQLAQFSSLEQLFNANQHLESIKSVQDEAIRFQSLDLIGKDILAKGDLLWLSEGETTDGAFQLRGQAVCTVIVKDEFGTPVRRIPLGIRGAGQHDFQWDGRDDNGKTQAPGPYYFDVMAIGESGEGIPVDTMVRGRVGRVNLQGEAPVIYLGEVPVQISQILDIRSP